MADNYLEKRYAEVFGASGGSRPQALRRPSLETLAGRCALLPAFSKDYAVHPLQTDAVAAICAKAGLCVDLEIVPIPDIAAVAVCSPLPESREVILETGKALQTMALKAAEMGLCTRTEECFGQGERQAELGLAVPPVAIVYIGKAAAENK